MLAVLLLAMVSTSDAQLLKKFKEKLRPPPVKCWIKTGQKGYCPGQYGNIRIG